MTIGVEIPGIFRASNLGMRRLAIPIISILLLTSIALAADDVKVAKVLAVKAYDQGRIAFWEGRVPIYDGYPFYDITLVLDQKKCGAIREHDWILSFELESRTRRSGSAGRQREDAPAERRRRSSGVDLQWTSAGLRPLNRTADKYRRRTASALRLSVATRF